MSNNQTPDSRRQNFQDFAGCFSEQIKKSLSIFYDYIADRTIIPYKIKNRELTIQLVDITAFSLKMVFHNVIIEDGRHPREILMTNVSGERIVDKKATGGYRIRFINGLITEGVIKESSFTFDNITTELKLWNYNFSTYPFSVGSDKVPWRTLYEPMAALVDKWQLLGEEVLNENEIENAILMQFMQTFLDLYLDDRTYIGYGKSTLTYEKERLDECQVTKRMLRAGRRVFELCQWPDLVASLEHFEEDRAQFFEALVMKITNKEGRMLFDYLKDILDRCTYDYPKRPELVSLYEGNYSVVKSTLNSLFKNRGYRGLYPDYVIKEKPRFIETNFVYERKYTYINEKQKMRMYSFVESVVDGGLQICAVSGSMLARTASEKTFLNQAIYCYFTDEGRRSAKITDSLYITPDMDSNELKQDIVEFFKRYMIEEVEAPQ